MISKFINQWMAIGIVIVLFLSVHSVAKAGVCEHVAEHANKGKLHELAYQGVEVDINNDGVADVVDIRSQGTAHVQSLSAMRKDGQPLILHRLESDEVRWVMDQIVVKYGTWVYILGKTENHLKYVSYIRSDNIERLECLFAQTRVPKTTTVVSNDDALCEQAITGPLNYITFDRLHAVTRVVLRDSGFGETGASQFASKVDIDNDGEPEYVVGLNHSSGRGRGCELTYLGVLNPARTAIVDGATNKLLAGKGNCRGSHMRPFIYEGAVYLEDKYSARYQFDHHKIQQIRHGQLTTMCKYHVRVQNEVID